MLASIYDRLSDDNDGVVARALQCKALVRTADPQALLKQLTDMITTRVSSTRGGGSSKSVQAVALKFVTSSLLPRHPQLLNDVVLLLIPTLSLSRAVH